MTGTRTVSFLKKKNVSCYRELGFWPVLNQIGPVLPFTVPVPTEYDISGEP